MRTRNKVFMLMLAGITLLFASCSETINNVEEAIDIASEEKSSELTQDGCCTFTGTLTEDDIAGLMEMREEEKLARDVYSYFYELHNQIIFSNISKSESAHTTAVLYLINGYGLTDPTPENIAEFSNPLFSDLYEQLSSAGSATLVDALKTGAFIEEYDIADLQRLVENTENEDILRVYGHLLEGSKNHLRAFTAVLNRYGETYTPTVIPEDEYQEILDNPDSADNGNTGNTSGTTSNTPGVCDGTGPNA